MEFTALAWILMVQNPFEFRNTWCFNDCAQTQSEIYINDMVSNLQCCWLHKQIFILESLSLAVITVHSWNLMWLHTHATKRCTLNLWIRCLPLNWIQPIEIVSWNGTHMYIVHCRLFNVFTGCLCYILYECFHVDYAALCCDIGNAN